jgi:hypothetical protein
MYECDKRLPLPDLTIQKGSAGQLDLSGTARKLPGQNRRVDSRFERNKREMDARTTLVQNTQTTAGACGVCDRELELGDHPAQQVDRVDLPDPEEPEMTRTMLIRRSAPAREILQRLLSRQALRTRILSYDLCFGKQRD